MAKFEENETNNYKCLKFTNFALLINHGLWQYLGLS